MKNKEESVPHHTTIPHECGEIEEINLKNLLIVVVLDLDWNADLPNTEPQCIMMFQRAHIHR